MRFPYLRLRPAPVQIVTGDVTLVKQIEELEQENQQLHEEIDRLEVQLGICSDSHLDEADC